MGRPFRTQFLKATMLLFCLLLSAPVWGKTFIGQLVLAEGFRQVPGSVNGQIESFETFTFIEDINGKEYDLTQYEGKLPHNSTSGTLDGELVDNYTIAVVSFVEAPAARIAQGVPEAATVTLPQTASLLTIKVNMVGNYSGQEFTLADNLITEEDVRYHIWERQWNLHQYFGAVTRNQLTWANSLDGDSVPDFAEVTLTPSSDACELPPPDNPSTCSNLRRAANCALQGSVHDPVNYRHRVYIGPSGWECGLGLGTVGNPAVSSMFVAMVGDNINIMIHELGHNLGLQHSNQLTDVGITEEYADQSCQMGYSISEYYQRRGFNAVQLSRMGLMGGGRTHEITDSSSNASGELYSTYFQEIGGPVTKLVKLGDSSYYLTYRSPVNQKIDQMADYGTKDGILSSYTGRLLVHYLEPATVGAINKNQITIVGEVDVGATAVFGDYSVHAHWQNDDKIRYSIGPAPVAVPARPSDIINAGTIVARAEASIPTIANSTDWSATCKQPSTSTLCLSDSYSLDLLDEAGGEQDIFARLKINVKQGAIIDSASLRLQVAANVNSLPEIQGGTGAITVQVQVEDSDNAADPTSGDPRLRLFTQTQSSTFATPLHGNDEVSFDITTLIQAMVNRPGWVGGNYIVLNLRRTAGDAGTDSVGFYSAKSNSVTGWFGSPRVIIDIDGVIFESGFE